MKLRLDLDGISARKIAALRTCAARSGLSVDAYIAELIEADLALNAEVRVKNLEQLAVPFERALRELSIKQLDHLSRNRECKRRSASRRTRR
jgi:hypothetical protein